MVVNISPSLESVRHSVKSLKFAATVNACVVTRKKDVAGEASSSSSSLFNTPKSTPRDLSPLISTTHRSRPPLPKRPMHLAGCTTPKMTGVGGKKTAAAAEASSSSSHLFKTPVSSLKNPSPLSAHRSTYSLPPLTIQTLPRIPLVHYAGG